MQTIFTVSKTHKTEAPSFAKTASSIFSKMLKIFTATQVEMDPEDIEIVETEEEAIGNCSVDAVVVDYSCIMGSNFLIGSFKL